MRRQLNRHSKIDGAMKSKAYLKYEDGNELLEGFYESPCCTAIRDQRNKYQEIKEA